MEALRNDVVLLYKEEDKRKRDYEENDYWHVHLNGERIGHVSLKKKNRWVEDPETPEAKAERMKSYRYSYSRAPGHNEPYNYYCAYIADKDDDRCDEYVGGEFPTLFAARNACVAAYKAKGREPKRRDNITYLPSGDCEDFYPTPSALAGQMISLVKWNGVRSILEPSAGKGDLVDAIKAFQRQGYTLEINGRKHRCDLNNLDIDCIEIDQNLRYILQGKQYRVVHDDFLTYNTRKQYDLIIMNPPFSDGDKHLLKALEMQGANGGQIVCLLNAETLRNTHSNSRQTLAEKLRKYGAKVEYIKGAFAHSERPSQVEIALVYVNIPIESHIDSEFFERMKEAYRVCIEEDRDPTEIAPNNMIERMIREYNIEVDATLRFLREYKALMPHIQDSKKEYHHPIISINIGDTKYDGSSWRDIDNDAINAYMRCVRTKYWEELLHKGEITGKLTSNLRDEYYNSVSKMADYDFSLFNIEQVIVSINAQIISGIEGQIMSLFDKLSAEHSYCADCGNNIHYYNGWKTNKAHKIGMKVILPINGFSSYSWEKNKLDGYHVAGTMADIEKTFDYLDGKRHEGYVDAYDVINNAIRQLETKNIDFKYFTATFYKKGTVHLKFTDERVVEALNIYAGRQRSWLPPYYGKTRYEDMPEEGQTIIDEFQGREAYEKVMNNPGVYLIGAKQFAALTAGN